MKKKFKVIVPYLTLLDGDILEPSENGEFYTAEHSEEFDRTGANGESYTASVHSSVNFSSDYVKDLLKHGYIEEYSEDNFVNVFDEIDKLLSTYQKDLAEVNADKDSIPACLKVEKTTVLSNLIKVLTHLKSLKK